MFEHIYAYVRQHNDYVNGFLCAAEEMQNMDDHELQHTVLLLAGKRTHQQIRRDRAAQQTQFAGQTDAGEHGVLRSMPEMCVLCPRTVAANERSAILVNMRQGGGLQRIPIEHRAFDALYNVFAPSNWVRWMGGQHASTNRERCISIVANGAANCRRKGKATRLFSVEPAYQTFDARLLFISFAFSSRACCDRKLHVYE